MLSGGAVLGTVPESFMITHKILLHPHLSGKVKSVVPEGEYTLEDVICELETPKGVEQVKMYHRWPVRHGRPYGKAACAVGASRHRPADHRHLLPDRQGGDGGYPGRVWHRQDRYPAQPRQVVGRGYHRIYRMRRAGQRDDRCSRRFPQTARTRAAENR